jgi:UDP-glucose 4-epimerase
MVVTTTHRILITGGAGFIASHLADAFLARGYPVAVIDNLSSGQDNCPNGATLHPLDIRDPAVADVFAELRPTVLCHHAAQMDVRKSVEDPGFDAEVNVVGTLRLLELCRKHGTERVLFASTGGAIYGVQDTYPADERHACRPVSPYGCSKLAIEHYMHYYSVQYGLKAAALRYANVYGPRQNTLGEAGVIAIFCDRLLRGQAPTIFGDGEQTRDFVYVGDVVAANLAALDHGLVGAFNVATGVETSINQVFARLRQALNAAVAAERGPARAGDILRSCLDAGKLRSATDWRPATSIADGLAATAAYFRDRLSRR